MSVEIDYDPITGIPRMTALPVAVARLVPTAKAKAKEELVPA
jgi:hypothetical protein